MTNAWKQYLKLRALWPEQFGAGEPLDLSLAPGDSVQEQEGLGVLEEHPRWLWVRELAGGIARERPVYLDSRLEQEIEGYFYLVETRPELFTQDELVPLCLERKALLDFGQRTGERVGLVHDNGIFYQVLADLVKGSRPYAYTRIIYPDRKSNGTVIIPRLTGRDGVDRFGILQVFRHSLRKLSGGEFPRGFLAPGLTPEENAAKELWEEFGVHPSRLKGLTLLGETRPDTGISAGQVQIYLASIEGEPPVSSVGYEGIAGAEWLTLEELQERVRRGVFLDGLSQSALLLYQLRRK